MGFSPSIARIILLLSLWVWGCDEQDHTRKEESKAAGVVAPQVKSSQPPLGPPADRPQPMLGMVYIPPGALVVGTSPDKRPRRADRELPGEQMMLDGFYIDRFAYPNEEGAIPGTNITHPEAAALCADQGKRLCSELEWERACKGPDNRTYEYGEIYREGTCRTGRPAQLRPSGYNVGCQSDFGVRDMHGGPFEWTADEFGRGRVDGEISLRGGNSVDGEVFGRCTNTEPSSPQQRSGVIGFRCCAGPPNTARIELERIHSAGLIPRVRFDEEIEKSLLDALPPDAVNTLTNAGKISRQRVWLWRPVPNEEIHMMAICGRGRPTPRGPRCGLFLARVVPGNVQGLAWVSSGEWVPNLHRPGPQEMLDLIGGDKSGSFKRLITYRFGEIRVGEATRGTSKVKKRK